LDSSATSSSWTIEQRVHGSAVVQTGRPRIDALPGKGVGVSGAGALPSGRVTPHEASNLFAREFVPLRGGPAYPRPLATIAMARRHARLIGIVAMSWICHARYRGTNEWMPPLRRTMCVKDHARNPFADRLMNGLGRSCAAVWFSERRGPALRQDV
jgi:hypothetical protein